MEDQHDAWRRLIDARLRNLEGAIQPRRIRRDTKGKPLPPLPYEPGDRRPLTRWLELRLTAVEMLIRLMLDCDVERAYELDIDDLEPLMRLRLDVMQQWLAAKVEPNLTIRTTAALVMQAQAILMEDHAWPLEEMEIEAAGR